LFDGARHESFCTVIARASERICCRSLCKSRRQNVLSQQSCVGWDCLPIADVGDLPTTPDSARFGSERQQRSARGRAAERCQEDSGALQDNGQYGAKVDGIFGLRTRASIRGFQKAENLPVTGQLDTQTAGKLGVRPEGREQTSYETTPGKPSAGIKWDGGSRRTSKTLRRAVNRPTTTVPPA